MKWNLVNGKANVDKKRTDGGKLRGNSLVCGRVECGKKIEDRRGFQEDNSGDGV